VLEEYLSIPSSTSAVRGKVQKERPFGQRSPVLREPGAGPFDARYGVR